MYIQYTSVDLACLLIYQVSRVVLLQWPFLSLQKHLVSGLGSTLGFFTRAANDLLFHEVSLLPLPFLKLVVLLTINNWCSFLISTFAVSNIASCSRIIIYPWYVIVHHEALIAWWQWLWRTITISSGRLTPTRFKRLQYSDNLSTCSMIELFSLSLQA